MLCRVVAVLVSCVVAEAVWAAPPSIILPGLEDYACATSISSLELREQFSIYEIEGGTATMGKLHKLPELLRAAGLNESRSLAIDTFIKKSVHSVAGGKAKGGILLEIQTLFDQKMKDREITVVLLSEDTHVGRPIDNTFLLGNEFGANRWLIMLPSHVWQDEAQFAHEVVLGIAPAAAVEFAFKWKEACQTIVREDRDPRVPFYALLVDERTGEFRKNAVAIVLALYRHLVWHQLIKLNDPERLTEFRRGVANGVGTMLWDLVEPEEQVSPAMVGWIHAGVSEASYWDFTLDALSGMNESILKVARRGN